MVDAYIGGTEDGESSSLCCGANEVDFLGTEEGWQAGTECVADFFASIVVCSVTIGTMSTDAVSYMSLDPSVYLSVVVWCSVH